MNRAEELEVFVQAVEAGGFSAAARKLQLTPSALSKLISRLEDRLGARLLHRTTRRLSLTVEGEAFYQRIRPLLTALTEAEAAVSLAADSPRGLLRVRCGSGFAMHHLTQKLPLFLARYPEVELDLVVSDDPAPPEDQSDMTIQVGLPEEPTAVVRHLFNVERLICAAPAYLERFGTPQTPDDLYGHNCLWISGLPALRRWPFDTDEGIRVIHVDGNVIANNAEMVLQLALAGVGITRLANMAVTEAIASGRLVPLLSHWHHVEPIPLIASYPSSRNLSPKVRAMVDFLVAEFSPQQRPRREGSGS